jgi:hypothetical protein
MKLDTLVLIILCAVGAVWLAILVVGMISLWPVGLIGLALISVPGYIIYRVIADRMRNREDDYYEKNIDR